jgi:hypothetical protein
MIYLTWIFGIPDIASCAHKLPMGYSKMKNMHIIIYESSAVSTQNILDF